MTMTTTNTHTDMARPRRMTVDYFPHFVKYGRTICILEAKYGNDGYAFWFKLLEILGEADGHYYDCRKAANWEYLQAKTHTTAETAESILATLIDLDKVDAELWREYRVIWVENFVSNLEDVYRTRNTSLPEKPSFLRENPTEDDIFSEKTPEKESFLRENPTETTFSPRKRAKEKESKEKERIENPSCEGMRARVREVFGLICSSFPEVDEAFLKAHKVKLDLRIKEMGDDWEKTFADVCRKMEASDFLKGQNGSGWKASFEWLIQNGENWRKVLKGNYDNAEKTRTATRRTSSVYIPYTNDDWK